MQPVLVAISLIAPDSSLRHHILAKRYHTDKFSIHDAEPTPRT